MPISRRTTAAVAAAAAMFLLPVSAQAVSPAPDQAKPDASATQDTRAVYTVANTDVQSRTEINRSGAVILSVKDATATVEATAEQAAALTGSGIELQKQEDLSDALKRISAPSPAGDFPEEDRDYHNYDEVQSELDQIVKDHPQIAQKGSIGKSSEGRDIPMLKISDNVGEDEDEPEVLFSCNVHAREHLTTEMCMHLAQRFTNDQSTKKMVDEREIYIVPVQNPDGSIKDYEQGQYMSWRKNTQDGHGTDVNRNYDYMWDCCGGSSDDPQSETYHGTEGGSSPEAKALQDFADSRVIDGEQQIKAHIDFHTYSELILYPFGHTEDDVTDGMTQEEHDRFANLADRMAETNGYTPQQSSDLYITDGDSNGYMWGKHKILSFTFEMYPGEGGADGFYPPDEVIPEETQRNDQAVDMLLEEAGK